MELEVHFWGLVLDVIGNIEKSDMKMGYNFDPLLKEQFEYRLFNNSITNS